MGLASIIIGEALVGPGHLGLTLAGAVMGSILFRLMVAVANCTGLDPVDLKIITAGTVFLALIIPQGLALVKGWAGRPRRRGTNMLEISEVSKTFHPNTPNEVQRSAM